MIRLTHEQKTQLLALTHMVQDAIVASYASDASAAVRGAGLSEEDVALLADIASRYARNAGQPDESAPAWLTHLFQQLTDGSRAIPTRDRLLRLQDCLLAIPEYGQYALLIREYGGAAPGPRPGRDPREAESFRVNYRADPDSSVAAALRLLRRPSRVTYVLDGTSDLDRYFSADDKKVLGRSHIYVADDLDRFPRAVDIPSATDELVAHVHAYRARKQADG